MASRSPKLLTLVASVGFAFCCALFCLGLLSGKPPISFAELNQATTTQYAGPLTREYIGKIEVVFTDHSSDRTPGDVNEFEFTHGHVYVDEFGRTNRFVMAAKPTEHRYYWRARVLNSIPPVSILKSYTFKQLEELAAPEYIDDSWTINGKNNSAAYWVICQPLRDGIRFVRIYSTISEEENGWEIQQRTIKEGMFSPTPLPSTNSVSELSLHRGITIRCTRSRTCTCFSMFRFFVPAR
jgi:hypothetical protein